eukprot:TRINITY_DN5684_c0_g1_i1.p1 TRINITY_DN5684_c0_g1~~TRINITY_DN5684_c0_g1_i1.p1  ORF type:complete len:167 (+),score=44.90 TRINITY_DN5684_c0_g1_i1:23-502(+)
MNRIGGGGFDFALDDLEDGAMAGIGSAMGATQTAPTLIAAVINGHHTELVITPYSNVVFIIVTQLGKIGTLMQVNTDIAGVEAGGDAHYSVNTLLGKRDDPVLTLYAQQLAAVVNTTSVTRSLLLGISIKDNSLPTLNEVVKLVKANVAAFSLPKPQSS